ncbi:ABC transporter ATP-binding protein [Polyangium jinanense]|uniref:ATP-binding cassette domain-containing protein n=1 Tax=Polyangium jinanense TaxID=2829994 RepID=A0A9X3XBZ5_9BACT|nr:ATP-binding cassette domain-containing protein [Polyangium jinanense]MDC3960334.1 ATP-binding cassette domain-containing protein [Polyangium jinanense]MDC3987497.1 ATP-binding cassette domain-containing protein [Polyangium jinanense]
MTEPLIRIEDITKSFGARTVLRGVNLSIPRGCLYGLIGPGASGKSVLLKLITGLYRPDAGRILVEGQDVHKMSELELQKFRLRFGMLFQNNALFDYMTVGENIAFPLRRLFDLREDEIAERVADRLRVVSLPGFEDRLPAGLSGGQKKRVGVARATITKAEIVLYDEPAAGLDPVTSQRIFEMLRDEQRAAGATVVMVSSDLDRLLTVTDRVGMLYRGRLVFDGTTEEAKTSNDPYVRQFVHGLTEGPL